MKAMAILLEEAKATDSGRPEEPYYCPTERESGQVGVRPTGQPFPTAAKGPNATRHWASRLGLAAGPCPGVGCALPPAPTFPARTSSPSCPVPPHLQELQNFRVKTALKERQVYFPLLADA